ncbi:MAG: hypothetical protein ACO218_11655 [Steroidobacteraceae bacterium]
MTFMGFVVLAVVVGGWVYAGIRLTPMYLNYMRIASSLEKVRDELRTKLGAVVGYLETGDPECPCGNIDPLRLLSIVRNQ